MNGLKNIAGHDCSLFFCRFVLTEKGIDFVLNEAIAEDMYRDIDEQVKPLAHACCETLLRYRHFSVSKTIMDVHLLDTGELEIMLSRGLGKYIQEKEKQRLFADAKNIYDLLDEVMTRATEEADTGKRRPKESSCVSHEAIEQGLEALGKDYYARFKQESMQLGYFPKPGFSPLRPEELPHGVTASPGYDHRGVALVFRHTTLGELGRIVLIGLPEGKTLLQSDVYLGPDRGVGREAEERKQLFLEVVAIVEQCFQRNFPD
jgi:hypothetical protein